MAKRRPARAPRRIAGGDDIEWESATGWRRWWNLGTKTAVGIGAVASAAAGLLALWPGPDPADVAKINTVQVTADVPLSEYRQRLAAAHVPETVGAGPWGEHASVARPGAVPVRATLAPGGDPPPPAPEPDEGETGPADEEPTADPSTPGPSGGTTSPPSTSEPPQAPAAGENPPIAPELARQAYVPPEVPSQTCERIYLGPPERCQKLLLLNLTPTIDAMSTDENGGPLPTEEAVGRVVELFEQTRVSDTGGESSGEPVGVVVAVDVELVQMRDEPVFVSWSMWQAGGATRLYGEWLNTNLAYRLKATSDHDTASVDFWIPLPSAPGPYFIRTTLVADGDTIASADSEHFR